MGRSLLHCRSRNWYSLPISWLILILTMDNHYRYTLTKGANSSVIYSENCVKFLGLTKQEPPLIIHDLVSQRDWDKRVPFVMLANRSSIRESTREFPSYMMSGRELLLTVDLTFRRTQDRQIKADFIQDLMTKLECAWPSDRQKRYYDRKTLCVNVTCIILVFNWSIYRYCGNAYLTSSANELFTPFLVDQNYPELSAMFIVTVFCFHWNNSVPKTRFYQ